MPTGTASAAACIRQTLFWQPASLLSTATAGFSGPDGWHGIDPYAVCTLPASGVGLIAQESPPWNTLAWDPTPGSLPAENNFPMLDFEFGTEFTQFADFSPAAAMPHLSPSTASLGNDFATHNSSGHSSPHGVPLSPGSASGSGSMGAPGPHRKREAPEVLLRRQRNTIAARKYRQKKFDRIDELEKALEMALQERDDLKLRLARQEAETDALKRVMGMGKESKP